jgi:hypothetical protein
LDGLQTLPHLLGMTDKISHLAVAIVLSLLILAFVFANKEFRQNRDNLLAGIVVGGVVVAGWYATGHLGFGEDPETMELAYLGTDSRGPESMTFVGPLAYTMDLWAYWRDKRVTFGVASVFGIIVGSFIYSLLSRSFRWEYFNSPQDMFRHILGAILMGFGGITAMGCTIGNGCFHFGDQFIHRILWHRRGLCDHHENSVLLDDARCLMQMFHSSCATCGR